MKCPTCKTENKDVAKSCKKCGTLLNVQPMWSPSWQWHARTLGILYAALLVVYFALNWFLQPYLRDIPAEVTPWLKNAQKLHK